MGVMNNKTLQLEGALAYITTHNGQLAASGPPQLGLIRQITSKYKKIKNFKFIDKVNQSVYI